MYTTGVDNKKPTRNKAGLFLDPSFPYTHMLTSIVGLHLVAEVNVHGLDVGVVVEGVLSQLAANCAPEVIKIKL